MRCGYAPGGQPRQRQRRHAPAAPGSDVSARRLSRNGSAQAPRIGETGAVSRASQHW